LPATLHPAMNLFHDPTSDMAKHLATITLIGHDKAGVIARITQLLFQLGANIEAMEEQVTRGQFSMTLQASWTPARFDRCRNSSAASRPPPAASKHGSEDPLRAGGPATAGHPRHEGTACARRPAREIARGSARQPVVVIGNRPDFGPLARRASCLFTTCPGTTAPRPSSTSLQLLEKHEVDFIVLARFMKILSPNFVWRWKNKIINIHPSLLPAFPGANAYRQAYERGVKVVGVTAHFVTPNLDEGPIIAQEVLRVRSDEALAGIVKRGQALETRCIAARRRAYVTKRPRCPLGPGLFVKSPVTS
jgi:formyltetrahydrofolate deformylase